MIIINSVGVLDFNRIFNHYLNIRYIMYETNI